MAAYCRVDGLNLETSDSQFTPPDVALLAGPVKSDRAV